MSQVSAGWVRDTCVNIRTHISERLWEAVAGAYDPGNYAHAVVESMRDHAVIFPAGSPRSIPLEPAGPAEFGRRVARFSS